jgi:DNA-binding transcriptional MerR regulator
VRDLKVDVPDKLYFKIGEVAALVGVKPYVLRYWESEFSMIRPTKTRSKHRLYRRRDVETLMQIRWLLHDERFTIEGAKKKLKTVQKAARQPAPPVLGERTYRGILVRVKKDIESIHRMLS